MYETLLNTFLLLPNISEEIKETMINCIDIVRMTDKNQLYDFVVYDYSKRKERITYAQFMTAYNKAVEIKEKAKKLGFEILGIESTVLPKRLKDIMNPLTVLYVKGNINCLNMNAISCYGKDISSDFVNKSSVRIGSRIAENKVALIASLDMQSDLSILQGVLKSQGNVIALIGEAYENYIMLYKSNIEKILKNGGCIVSLNPPDELNHYIRYLDNDSLKVRLSDAIVIIDMHKDIPIKRIQDQGKELYCISFPENHRNQDNELLISSRQALPIRNREDIIILTKKILNNYYVSNNCTIHCYKSSREINYYDQILLKINTRRLGISTFDLESYDVTKIEIELDENRIIKVIDHLNRRIYTIKDDCIVTVNKDKFEKFTVLYDVKNIIRNCDIRIYQLDSPQINVSINTYNREKVAFYSVGNNLESNQINIEFNNKNELMYIFDKDKEIYFYPLRNKKILVTNINEKHKFREVYFNSRYDSDCIHPREPVDWDCAWFTGIDDLIIKYHPNSYRVFRLIHKRNGTVFYINPFYNEEIHKICLKDYEENIVTNINGKEDDNIKKKYNTTLKEEIKDRLLKLAKSRYNNNEAIYLKEFLYKQLKIYVEKTNIDRTKQEYIADYKYEQICSAIDEIVDYKSESILKENQSFIFDMIDNDLSDIFDDEDKMLPIF